ncbi:restriction endonuclease subunit S [Acidithiobacillus ferriphilus]|jgi:Restriction endonuclease S subunits|uniref:restriction endonuclease subunit S n=1 Tax=Acidithiobacillus ferriphilus TaxID=1689834 RepID=UPI001C075710|nr:restriction endonuclease subunit S [Acidithiobacillus ferriphilus]MBU2852799.1 restriction endonuclease subunit S [Acidithiobacillus ferriphilus]
MTSKTKTTATKEEATPALVPKLRFPEFREAWKIKRLGNLFSDRQESGLTGLPLLSLMDKEGIVPQGDSNRKNNSNSDKSKYLRVVPGDIAYNTMRMWEGRSAHVGLEGLVSPAYTVCEPQSGVHSLFFSHYFKTPQLIEQFRRYSQGLVKDTLNLKYAAFSQISVPSPTYPEQQKIAECLSSVDELMAAQARKVDALKTHKKWLMQQLFPREGETQPRLRFPEFQNAGEWEEKSLGQLIEIASGQVDPKQPPYCDSPQIGSENIESHSGKLVNVKSAGDKGVISGNYAFDENDILYSKIRPALNKVAAPAFTGICSADIYPIRPADGSLLRSYLFYLLLSQDFLDYAIRNSERGKIPKINRDALVTYKTLIPSPDEQQRIASCLSGLDALITAETQKLEALKTHKKGLMQQLFPSPGEVEA